MTDRLKSMKRLARVQTQVKRLAEADLQAAEGRKAEVEAAALDLEAFVREADLPTRMISMAIGQRRRLAVRLLDAERDEAAQREVTQEARRRVKLAERMVETLAREEGRLAERRELERLIEAMANPNPDASSP